MQRYVLIAPDGCPISTHRDADIATTRLRHEPGGYVWDRFASKVVAGTDEERAEVYETPRLTRFERMLATTDENSFMAPLG
jgi:hypothetical protein